ncbi:esterase YqiA [Vibrio hippocampi]|uniref:Esterase YqiA n=1 Tax=Vibrio hippocampi TaxID=654686 RepID=A0ABM8ZJ98_9VIBR|nr:esterase YqiA [Vibrio hippocampi]CAH0526947.1 hypothetical protein VHP8226_02300 [Vibrio hippocampi]
MNTKPSLLLYIHGFNSSPLSYKAQVVCNYCQQHRPDIKVVVPQVPCYPEEAAETLKNLVNQLQSEYNIALVGSSLGGYLSTWLNHHFGFKAVLVNPAVRPYELLQDYLGPQQNPYTHEQYTLEQQHIVQLRALDIAHIQNPDDFWLLQQEGDEVLDYRQAVEKYRDSKQTVESGGDHSFVGFERFAADIVTFLSL